MAAAMFEEVSVQTVDASVSDAHILYTPVSHAGHQSCRPGFVDSAPDDAGTPVVTPLSADAGPTGYFTDSDDEDNAAIANLSSTEEETPGGAIAQLLDVTVLFEDDKGIGAHAQPEAPQLQEPVLSFVSVNPQTAASFDVLRGSLKVLPEFPSCGLARSGSGSSAVRTLRISCGRDPANTVVLRDSRISQRHFTIRVRCAADGVVALDIHDQSSNGTFVNGRRVGRGRRQPIVVGDRIVALPAEQAGLHDEVGYQLLHDTKGAACFSLAMEAPLAGDEGEDAKDGMQKPGVPKELEKDLKCGVCTDLFYRCLTLVPCGHNFCAACLLRWRHQSSRCPGCRAYVRQAVRNRDMDKMVQTFVQGFPALARTPGELQQMLALERIPENEAMLHRLVKGPRMRHPEGVAHVATPQHARQQPQTVVSTSVCVVS